MPKVVTSTELQKNSDIIIDWAKSGREAIIVETAGQPSVAILPFDEYQNYLEYKKVQHARADRFKRLRQLAEQNATYELSEAEALTLVEVAREEVHQNSQDKPAES